MSDTLDSRLIVSLLHTNNGRRIYELGLSSDMFESDARMVFHFIETHYKQYNKLPDKREIARHYANFPFRKATEPLEHYAKDLVKRFRYRRYKETIGAAVEELNRCDDMDISKSMIQTSSELAMLQNCGVTMATDYRTRGERIEANIYRNEHMSAEFSFGFEALDKDLIGMERGDLTLLAGPSGGGKTWLLLTSAIRNWRRRKKKVLVVSLEMKTSIIEQRMDAILCDLDYDRYRRGKLTALEKAELIDTAKELDQAPNFLRMVSFENYDRNATSKLGSVASIRSLIQLYEPDMLYVDGLYLGMSMKWEEATAFANDFHVMLEETAVPCMATTQLKQEADETAPKLKDIAFTQGFQHAAAYVLICGRDGKGPTSNMIMSAVKVREAQDRTNYFINFKPAVDIEIEAMVQPTKNLLYVDDDIEDAEVVG